jgi:Na+/H+ antiporter NhaC
MSTWLILLQIFALALFIFLIWPHLKNEEWKEKFIQNKQAFSLLIVFVLILGFVLGMSVFFDVFFPVERLDK